MSDGQMKTGSGPIGKVEAAGRQLDAAIDLYFSNADSLAIHTLAYASFKLLFDLYPHRKNDGFAKNLDRMMAAEGWRLMSGPANFLKHADRDPDAVLVSHNPQQAFCVIGLAVVLYRRITGNFSAKMRAFDCWAEQEGHDDLKIVEIDENKERADSHKEIRDAIRTLPHDQKMIVAQKQYQFFLANYEQLAADIARNEAAGLTVTDMLNRRGAERAKSRQ